MQLDATDIRILKILKKNADLTNKEIACMLGMSTTPVFERIKKLKQNKAIKKVVAIVDPKTLGKELSVICNISLKEHARHYLELFEKQITELEEVALCYHIAGQFDYLLHIHIESMDAYQRFITQKLADLENIAHVQSSFIMKKIITE